MIMIALYGRANSSSLSPRRLIMHRFKNILCVVNPDEKASAVVKRARELATLQGTSLDPGSRCSGRLPGAC